MENNRYQVKKFIENYVRNQETLDFYKLTDEFKTELLKFAIDENCGNVTHAAEFLHIRRTTCTNLIRRYGVHAGKMGQTKVKRCPHCGVRIVMKINEVEISGHRCIIKKQG